MQKNSSLIVVVSIILNACASAVGSSGSPAVKSNSSSLTPVVHQTSTLVDTSTPAASPTPPPRWFSEEFNSQPAYWTEWVALGAHQNQLQVGAGVLDIRLDEPNTWIYSLFQPYQYDDVRVDAYFEPRGSEPSSTGVVCRYSKHQGWYEFNISREGAYNILLGKWLSEELVQYIPILYDESEYIKPDLAGYEIGLGCLEDELWLYINGKLIRKVNVQRYGLSSGRIGLAVASFENTPVISAFDWITVSAP